MARPRKTTTTTPQVEEVVQETETVIEAPVAPEPVEVKETKKKDEWEIKSRQYYLTGGKSPLTYTLASKHTPRHPLLWFDTETNTQREIRYATNQKSCFVDEQNGSATMEHIVFKDGVLNVPKEKQSLQRLLSIYHPHKDKLYREFDPVQEAEYGLEDLETELEAMTAAREIDIDHAEAILRAEKGFIIVGQETDGSTTPVDLDMNWIVSKKKYDFIGKRSLYRSDTIKKDRKQLVG